MTETTLMNQLLSNVHDAVDVPHHIFSIVSGSYVYYHYLCDGINDVGWGCGYRTLQTICSWIILNEANLKNLQIKQNQVPSILDIQKALVNMNDKTNSFLNSKEWIGSFEICLCLDYFYDIPCKIHHIRAEDNFFESLNVLKEHFKVYASPVMMGGDSDAASKCILGICGDNEKNCKLLILDPHCSTHHPSVKTLLKENWVCWRGLDTFIKSSFYNLCLPQCGVLSV